MTIFASVVVLLTVFFAGSIVITGAVRAEAEAAEAQAAQAALAQAELREKLLLREKEERRMSAFDNLDLVARGAVIYDINSDKIIFARNPDEVFPIASITKTMTVLTAADYLDNDSVVFISERAINTEGESGLLYGENWLFKELVDLTMVISSNDGAVAIAEAAGKEIIRREGGGFSNDPLEVFVEKMNDKARKIGLDKTIFYNPSGLDLNLETEAGALSSSRDIAKLFSYAITEYPGLLDNSSLAEITVRSLAGRSLYFKNTNERAGSTSGLLASKTGNTLQAGGTLAVAIDVGMMQPISVVVLGSTIADRTEDVRKLHEAAKIYFENL